ncbi:hypothetical protein PG993_003923 [Apiospora rasikravindrae]|uniref:Uncharacterized protein n=1 Tax=Apiospora rasikravindrae TaxID=990691 RepID=A0ABR1U157_9PEZI
MNWAGRIGYVEHGIAFDGSLTGVQDTESLLVRPTLPVRSDKIHQPLARRRVDTLNGTLLFGKITYLRGLLHVDFPFLRGRPHIYLVPQFDGTGPRQHEPLEHELGSIPVPAAVGRRGDDVKEVFPKEIDALPTNRIGAHRAVDQFHLPQARPAPLRNEGGEFLVNETVLDPQLAQVRHAFHVCCQVIRIGAPDGVAHAVVREDEAAQQGRLARQMTIEVEVQVAVEGVIPTEIPNGLHSTFTTPESEFERLKAAQGRGPGRMCPCRRHKRP